MGKTNPGLANFDLDVVVGVCPKLVQIIIEDVKVRGDIACLEKCPRLTWVYLRNTDCHGDVAIFHHFPEVTHLNLFGTKVSGDVQAFEAMLSRRCGGVVLKGTSITGNFDALKTKFPNKVHHD